MNPESEQKKVDESLVSVSGPKEGDAIRKELKEFMEQCSYYTQLSNTLSGFRLIGEPSVTGKEIKETQYSQCLDNPRLPEEDVAARIKELNNFVEQFNEIDPLKGKVKTVEEAFAKIKESEKFIGQFSLYKGVLPPLEILLTSSNDKNLK